METVKAIDNKSITSVTIEKIGQHLARVSATVKKYNLHDPKLIFNIDETRITFNKMTGRSI